MPRVRTGSFPTTRDTLLARFVTEFERVGGRAYVVGSLPDVSATLKAVLAELDSKRVVSWARREFRAWETESVWQEHRIIAAGDEPAGAETRFRSALLEAQVGITTVTHAVATTGSLVVTASPTRPRGVSLLPTTHIALVRQAQIVIALASALATPSSQTRPILPSALHVITGPSRTSDIENDITIGVHGPASVVAILLRESE